jgi:hypothetical protein
MFKLCNKIILCLWISFAGKQGLFSKKKKKSGSKGAFIHRHLFFCFCFQQKSRHHRDFTLGPPPLLPTVAAPEPSPPPPPEIDNVEDDDYDPAEDEILTKQSESQYFCSACLQGVPLTIFNILIL